MDAPPASHTPQAAAAGWRALLELPDDLFGRSIVSRLSRADRCALRASSRLCRRLVNQGAHGCLLDAARGDADEAARQLPGSFPALRRVWVVSTSDGGGGQCGAASGGERLERQLPALLRQLPAVCRLSYDGPVDRRQPGLDMTPTLEALASAPAASSGGIGGRQQLTRLELRAGRLPDSLMEVVGQLPSLRHLELTATAAVSAAPLARLTRLTELHMTVTPPLAAALAPLAPLRGLAALHLAALSPARGWGAALRLLGGCGQLRELVLVFADVSDGDMAALPEQLTRLDLHCSRHLTPACVPHLARLHDLRALQLAHTGLMLGPADLLLLGGGCPHLEELQGEFALGALADPPEARPQLSWALRRQLSLEQWPPPRPPAAAGPAEADLTPEGSGGSGWPPLERVAVTCSCSVATLAKLLHHCPQLAELELEGLGPNGNDVAATLAARAGRRLARLQLAGCSSMGVAACRLLGGGCLALRALSLVDVGLPAGHLLVLLQGLADKAAGAAPPLEQLRCERCSGLDGGVVAAGVGRLRGLRSLAVVSCDGLGSGGQGEAALLALAERLPRLVDLEVAGCRGVGPRFARAWEAAAAAVVRAEPGRRDPLRRVEWRP